MKYVVGDEFPEVIFNWMDDNFEVRKAASSELFDNKKLYSSECLVLFHLPVP